MDSNNLVSSLFSPFGREYCLYYYYLTVITFVFFVLSFVSALYLVITKKLALSSALYSLVMSFLLYFNNRLLYSMCVN